MSALLIALALITPLRTTAGDITLPMIDAGLHLPVVEVKINGKGPFRFGIDTCAGGYAIMSPSVAERLGLKPSGEGQAVDGSGKNPVKIKLYQLDRVDIGGHVVTKVRGSELPQLKGGHTVPMDGIIGFRCFENVTLTLDYPRQRVVISEKPIAPTDANVTPIRIERSIPSVEIKVNDKSYWCHLDSGSSGSINLPLAQAKELPLDGELKKVGVGRSVSNAVDIFAAPIKGTVTLAGHTMTHPTLTFADISRGGGNIGVQVMGNYAVSLDQRSKLVRFTPGEGAPKPKQARRYGLQIASEEPTFLLVAGTEPGSPAEKAGIKRGDKVTKINGKGIADLSLDERLNSMRQPRVTLTVERDGKELTIEMSLAG